jgi:uncharacterized repeat protein (TIGR03803 family)
MSQTTRSLLLLACLAAAAGVAQAQDTEVTLLTFKAKGGEEPFAGVIRDSAGNLYGTAYGGGASDKGVVYKLDTSGKEKVLYSFCSQPKCVDGANPLVGVIRDSAGNLYGTTYNGGASNGGVVYQVDKSGNETVLYSFCTQTKCADGVYPEAGVIRDSAGNLYGTTVGGGASNDGVVYKLDTSGDETVLYSFCSQPNCADGAMPAAGVVADSAGNLYGTTYQGGGSNVGVVYKLETSGNETVLHSFCPHKVCTDGRSPLAGVIRDSAGNLYGTTSYGGASGTGVVYKVETSGKETVLYSFCSPSTCPDGAFPQAGVIRDSAGNLYGTTAAGGLGYGAVYKLNTSGKETVLYSFCPDQDCGSEPQSSLVLDEAGNLYGTTPLGGSLNSYGIVFELKP